jgi:peroxiredoxin
MDMRALADLRVLDVEGRPVRLGDQWKSQPAVVVWLRHFGCVYCTEHAREMMSLKSTIEQAGGRLVFVGNGGPRHAKSFQSRETPGATVLTDPGLGSYKAIGARRGVLSTLGPQTWAFALRAFRSGARQTTVKGHAFQQGGVLVIAPRNSIAYIYLSKSAGDHPPGEDVLAALRRSTAAAMVDVVKPQRPPVATRG